jgi:heme/copper-type cytochrome/quinol oxidase subunit 2
MSQTSSQLPSGQAEQTESKWTVTRVAMIAGAVFGGIVVLLFVISFFFSIANVQGAVEFFRVLRDVFIIILALQAILITVALVVLVIQVANLVNLLQTEIKPLLLNLQETLNTAKGSAQFVGESLATPIIKASGFFAGAGVFLREVGGIRRAIRRSPSAAEKVNNEKAS